MYIIIPKLGMDNKFKKLKLQSFILMAEEKQKKKSNNYISKIAQYTDIIY
jgi:hypothetical protein